MSTPEDQRPSAESARSPKGLMALDGARLSKLVDDTIAMLRVRQPQWVSWLDVKALPAHVQQTLLEGAAHARRQAAESGEVGFYGTGGLWITFDPTDGTTRVAVEVAWVLDGEENTDA